MAPEYRTFTNMAFRSSLYDFDFGKTKNTNKQKHNLKQTAFWLLGCLYRKDIQPNQCNDSTQKCAHVLTFMGWAHIYLIYRLI